MEELSFDAILTDAMSATLDAIAAALENVAEVMGQVAEAISTGMADSAAATGELQVAIDDLAVNMEGVASSVDANTAALDANTEAADANAASTDASAASHDKLGSSAKAAIMPLGLAEAALVGVGAVAVHMAGDFQESLTTLVTGAGESASNLGMIHDGVLNMSDATGESTKQLTDGLFMIESAGHHGADALNVLQAAAEGAKVGAADLGVVADGTTTIMTDFSNTHITAAQAVNAMIATVASGKTHMQDLSAALAQILPTASSAGISLKDVMGAMATMTGEGVPAANAATYLRQTIIALEAPSKQTTDALAAVGLSTTQVADAMHKSLPDALKLITDAVGKKFPEGSAGYVEAMKQISGGSKQMQGMLDLTGQHMGTYQTNVKGINDATTKGGNTIQGWALVQKDFNTQLAQGGASLQTSMIKIGEALEPVATTLLKSLNPALKWLGDHGQAVAIVLGILAIAIGGALVTALGMATVAFIAANAAALPWIALGAGIALAIAGLVVAVIFLKTHWKQIGDWLAGEWHTITTAVGGWFSNLGTQAHKLWDSIAAAFGGIGSAIGGFFSRVGSTIHAGWAAIQGLFGAGIAFVHNLVMGFVHGILGLFQWLFDHNTYFHDLVIGIQREFQWIKATATAIWTDITGGLTKAWDTIKGYAEMAFAYVKMIAMRDWMLLEHYIIEPVQRVVALVQARISEMKQRLEQLWMAIVVKVQTTWDQFIGIIASIGGRIGSTVQDNVVTPITNVISNLLNLAGTWGHNFVQHLIDGIKNMAGAVGDAAKGIAGNIANFLGFHSPAPMGPGAEADRWMPNLGRMLASGLDAQADTVGLSARHLSNRVASVLGDPHNALPGGGSFPAAALAAGGGGGYGAGGGPAQITVILKDETGAGGFIAGTRLLNPDVMRALAQQVAQEMANQGLLQGRQPIGYTGGR